MLLLIIHGNYSNEITIVPSSIVLVLILPLLNFINKWDSYLSFSLYSDKITLHYIAIEKTQIRQKLMIDSISIL